MAVPQIAGDTHAPQCPVRLAGDVLGAGPPSGTGQVQPYELAHRLDVLLEVVEVLRLLLGDRPGVARRHRIDEHEVCHVEQGVLVVDQSCGRRHRHPVIGEPHPARSVEAEVEPHRGRSGTAVEGEDDGAIGGIVDIGPGVGDVEERRLLLALLLLQHEAAGGCRVGDLDAADLDRVLGGDGHVLVVLRRGRLLVLAVRLGGVLLGVGCCGVVGHGSPGRLRPQSTAALGSSARREISRRNKPKCSLVRVTQ